jgi:hypothetical protein
MEPRVELRVPSPMLRGTLHDIEVVIALAMPLEIDGIELRLRGTDGWMSFAQGLACERTHVETVRRMLGPSMLHAETHRFPFRVSIPSSMAPTHALAPAFSRAELCVTIETPRFWRSNIRARFPLEFREPPPGQVARVPMRGQRPPPGGPGIELGLGATQLVAGDQLLGTCAVHGIEQPHSLTLALVPELALHGEHGFVARRDGRPHELEIPVDRAGPQSFVFVVPVDAMPSFRADTHALSWRFEARLGELRTALPVEIVDASAASRAEPIVTVPAIVGAGTGPYR